MDKDTHKYTHTHTHTHTSIYIYVYKPGDVANNSPSAFCDNVKELHCVVIILTTSRSLSSAWFRHSAINFVVRIYFCSLFKRFLHIISQVICMQYKSTYARKFKTIPRFSGNCGVCP